MKVLVLVRFKEEVPDGAGKVITDRLINRGFTEVKGARTGKLIELDIEGADRDAAALRVKQMCSQLLVNSVIEEFVIHHVD